MTSQEVNQLTNGFLTQLRGIFTGLEKLPQAYEELQSREASVAAKEANSAALDTAILDTQWKMGDLDHAITSKQADLAKVQDTVTAEIAAERARQHAVLDAELATKRAELDSVNQELEKKKAVLAQLTA